MDKVSARNLSEALKAFLVSFEEENDVKVAIGSGKYDDTTLTLKIELSELAESGEALTRSANEFKALARSYGLNPEDLGKEFRDGVRTYRIVGLKPRASRYPIVAEALGDKHRYKFSAESVKMYLNRNKPKRSDADILEDLRGVECGLSPENLCCDGEASASHVMFMSGKLNAEKRALIAELGRTPTDKELYPELSSNL